MRNLLRKYYPAFILIGVSFIFYWPVFKELVSDWYYDQNYSHGFLIPLVSVYLFYRASQKFIKPQPTQAMGIIVIAVAMALLIVGTAGAEYFTTRFSYIVLLAGIAMLSIGWHNLKKAWFAFFFLLLMIPIPNLIYTSVTIPMQLFASKSTVMFLHAASVPSALSGNIIYLPNYPLEVAEACSGLRSLFSLLALSVLVGYLSLPGFWPATVLAALTFPIAIAANIFRIFTTAVLAYTVGPELADNFLHYLSGVLVFAVSLILVLIFRGVISWVVSRQRS